MSEQYFSTIPDGYKTVVEYAWEGKQSLKAMAALILDWSKALKVCGQELEKRAQQHPMPDSEASSTLKYAFDSMKQSVQTMGLRMQEVYQIMETDKEAFIELRHNQSSAKRESIKSYESSKKDLEKARSSMHSCKKSYDNACRKAEKAITQRDEATLSSDDKLRNKLPKFEQSARNAVAYAKKCELNYAAAVNEVRKLQKAHRTTEFKVLNDLQALEFKRIEASKATLTLIARKHLELCEGMKNNFEQSLKKIIAVNPTTDLDTFIAKAKQESKQNAPAPLVLEEYQHHHQPLLEKEGITSTFIAVEMKQPPPPGAPGGPPSGGPGGNPGPPPGPPGAKPAPPAPALNGGPIPPTPNLGVQAGGPPPLPDASSASVTGPPNAASKGFPQENKVPPPPKPAGSSSRPTVARAEYEFQAEEDTDLGFQVGDYIIVQDRSDPEWWNGHHPANPSKMGEFPANYVKIIQDPNKGMVKQAQALFDYTDGEEGDLTFNKDDLIDVLDDSDEGWWEGMLGTKVGRFPSNYTNIISAGRAATGR
eukprot:CAMPEP_0184494866 /NCGR_PEP_ID=MMETSP0113_2-20130426/29779_1 /TAXON_ID=91329 /ORGANISM="Norrisiella sphaerica, Strain BC52" /LENGTH=535 /DNA_ID=CAMNT_0026880789 /DNA_START=63 /DNA_END=1670 /DNA_ORIENTATION=+